MEPAWGDTLDRGGFLLGVETLCGLSKRLGGAIGWGRTFEGTVCAIEENERKHTMLAVYKEGKMMY